jgi:Kef-type K+ transport system membrane component KefB
MELEGAHHSLNLVTPLVLLDAAVLAVPLFPLFKLRAVIGYRAAGAAVGPSVLGLIDDLGSVRFHRGPQDPAVEYFLM